MIEAARIAVGGRFDHGPTTHLFDTLPWFEMLYRHCFAGQPLYLGKVEAVLEGQTAPVLLPLVGDARRMEALANWYSFSYAPLVGLESNSNAIDEISKDLKGFTRHVSLFPVLDEAGTATQLEHSFRSAGWLVVRRAMSLNHIIRLNDRSFADYWAARPGRLRRLVQRKGKHSPLHFEIHHQMTSDLWREYTGIYGASWKSAEPYADFVHALAQDAANRGALRLGVARMEGRSVAVQLWTIDNGVAHIHKLAHDEAARAWSPGTLLSHHMFAQAIDGDRVQTIDYGTGDNGYKRDWMEEARPMYRIDCFDPARVSLWPTAAKAMISRLVGRRNAR